MKLPEAYQSVTLYNGTYQAPFPPLGFCPFAEHQLGNGDTFGLYWPIGREDFEPIVAETYHDEWSIQPHFSTLDRFLSFAETMDEEEDDEFDDDLDDEEQSDAPSFDDPESPSACLFAARDYLKSQNVEKAIESLETAVTILPEYTEAQALLCTQYRRVGNNDAAIKSAIKSMISPPCFGSPPVQIAKWLHTQSSATDEIDSDPIWENRERLTLRFGGVRENDEYNVLRDSIDQYLANSEYVNAMTLMQNYSQLMYRETTSFQERNSFDPDEFVKWQRDVAALQYGKSRELKLTEN